MITHYIIYTRARKREGKGRNRDKREKRLEEGMVERRGWRGWRGCDIIAPYRTGEDKRKKKLTVGKKSSRMTSKAGGSLPKVERNQPKAGGNRDWAWASEIRA